MNSVVATTAQAMLSCSWWARSSSRSARTSAACSGVVSKHTHAFFAAVAQDRRGKPAVRGPLPAALAERQHGPDLLATADVDPDRAAVLVTLDPRPEARHDPAGGEPSSGGVREIILARPVRIH